MFHWPGQATGTAGFNKAGMYVLPGKNPKPSKDPGTTWGDVPELSHFGYIVSGLLGQRRMQGIQLGGHPNNVSKRDTEGCCHLCTYGLVPAESSRVVLSFTGHKFVIRAHRDDWMADAQSPN